MKIGCATLRMGDWNTCLRLFTDQGVVWLCTSTKHLALVGIWDRHCWGVGCLSDRLALSHCWCGRHNVPVEHIKGFAVGTSIVLVAADMYALFPFLQVLWHLDIFQCDAHLYQQVLHFHTLKVCVCVCVCRGVDKFVRVRGLGCC